MLALVTYTFFFQMTTKCSDPPYCSNVERIAFEDMVINVPEQGPVKLKDGKGYTPHVVLEGKDFGSDWEVTIEGDIVLTPAPGVTFRLINLHANHITGTGGWGYALMYACKEGRLRRILQSIGHLYGVDIKKIDDQHFTIRYGVYLKNDANCCPSMQSTDTYAWFESDGLFKKTKGEVEPWKEEE